MNETTVYIVCGVIAYLVGYMVVVGAATTAWVLWARKKLGPFWAYSLEQTVELYYPRWYDFTIGHKRLYFVVYLLLWPAMMPAAFMVMTKAVNRCLANGN